MPALAPDLSLTAAMIKILLVGASVRAAAGSLQRAGASAVAFDLFRDADLAAMTESWRLTGAEYPARIGERVAHLEPIPWMFTGAIENHPAVVADLSRRFPLLGSSPAALRLVRDPAWLAATARQAHVFVPEVHYSPDGIATDGSWLIKPVASGGGEGIARWTGQQRPDVAPVLYQARTTGLSLGATMLRDRTRTRLVGLTRQFLGRPGNRFAYRGSLGPWPVAEPIRRTIIRLGQVIGDAADLIGLFGMDLLVDGDRVWLIEVNPRYTASVEVLEAAEGRSILAEHLRACLPGVALDPQLVPPVAPVVAKAILFARSAGRWAESVAVGTPDLADLPHPGTEFAAGEPILTVFGGGATVGACQRDLASRIRRWRARIRVARS